MKRPASHPFWGIYAPLATLSGGGLLVLASTRFSSALVCSIGLLWVFTLSSLALRIPFLPRWGRGGISPFLVSFIGGLYILILFLVSPVLAMDSLFFLILCPLCCVSSGLPGRLEATDLGEGIIQAALESICLAVLILALALIREPLGYGIISLPGGSQGIVVIAAFTRLAYLPIRIISGSAGAFFLLGYGIALFRRSGGNFLSSPPDSAEREGRKE
jgi:hypothetical protein